MRQLTALVVQCLAVSLLGLMAGFFFAFTIDVAAAMAQLDASSYIATQQWINRVVRNAVFGGVYFGSTVLPFLAAAAAWWAGRRFPALGWLLIAVAYFLAVFWLTRSVNVPINNELATWNPAAPPAGWQQARDTWNEANLQRTVAAVVCFVGSVVLVALFGRARAKAG